MYIAPGSPKGMENQAVGGGKNRVDVCEVAVAGARGTSCDNKVPVQGGGGFTLEFFQVPFKVDQAVLARVQSKKM